MKVIDDVLEYIYENRGEVTRFQMAAHFAHLGPEKLKRIEDFLVAYGLVQIDENNNLVLPADVVSFLVEAKT